MLIQSYFGFIFNAFCQFSSFLSHKQQALNSSSPTAAGSQAPRLLEVLGRCNSQSGPSHRQLRRSILQREGVPGNQGWGLETSTACPYPQSGCFLNFPVWTLLEQPALWSDCMQGSTPATLGSPSSFPRPPYLSHCLPQDLHSRLVLAPLWLCMGTYPQPPLLPHSTMSVNS